MYDNEDHDDDLGTICVMEKYQSEYSYDFYLDVIYGDKEPFCDMCDPLIEDCVNAIDIIGTEED